MRSYKIPYLTRGHIKVSSGLLLKQLKTKPGLWLISLVAGLVVLYLLLWISNLDLFRFLIFSDIGIEHKLKAIYSTPKILFSSYELPRALLIITFSIFQGLNLGLLVLVLRSAKQRAEAVAGSSLAIGVTVLGAGCGACGTTLLTPVVAGLGAGAFIGADALGVVFMILGLLVTFYSIHRLSLMLAES